MRTRLLTLSLLALACSEPRVSPGPAAAADGVGTSDAPAADDTPSDTPDHGVAPDVVPVEDLSDAAEDAPAPDVGSPDADPLDASPTPDAITPPAPLTLAEVQAAVAAGPEAVGALAYDMPVCQGGTCAVLVKVAASSVTLRGDFNAWQEAGQVSMTPLGGNWWAAEVAIDLSSGLSEYKVVADGEWRLDPNNRYVRFGPFGLNSAIYGPGRSRLMWLPEVASPQLGNTRALYVHLPARYFDDLEARFPVLYLQDGFNVFYNPGTQFGSWHADATADGLIKAGLVEPLILVGIDTADRAQEYVYAPIKIGGNTVTPKLESYAAFLTDTVKPLVDQALRTRPEREHTAIAGSSLGGISSLYIAWTRWQTFGKVASFSGSYWIGEDGPGTPMKTLIEQNAPGVPPGGLRIYIDSGDSHHSGAVAYVADSWVHTDWTRNALIRAGWDNRAAWDTDGDLGTAPVDLPEDTPVGQVPALAWATAPPPGEIWATWLGLEHNLLSMVGHGHAHNEAAWEQRMRSALIFLFPGDSL